MATFYEKLHHTQKPETTFVMMAEEKNLKAGTVYCPWIKFYVPSGEILRLGYKGRFSTAKECFAHLEGMAKEIDKMGCYLLWVKKEINANDQGEVIR